MWGGTKAEQEELNMAHIFISYSRVDKNITKTLAELLSHAYDHLWYDTAKLVGGDEWWEKILNEIANCDHFIYLLSPESIASEWCQKELAEAQNQQKHIVPIRIRDRTPIPDNLKTLQCIDMFDKVTVRGINLIYASLIRDPRQIQTVLLDEKTS
jgi:serine/threonine kinase PknH